MTETNAYVRVYRAANGTEANLLKGLLEHAGMPVRLLGDGLAGGLGELPVDVMQVDIEVPVGYRQYARELLDEYESHMRDDLEAPAWDCSRCRESNPATFDVCWKCGTAVENTEHRNG